MFYLFIAWLIMLLPYTEMLLDDVKKLFSWGQFAKWRQARCVGSRILFFIRSHLQVEFLEPLKTLNGAWRVPLSSVFDQFLSLVQFIRYNKKFETLVL